jgi:hypothetical protein
MHYAFAIVYHMGYSDERMGRCDADGGDGASVQPASIWNMLDIPFVIVREPPDEWNVRLALHRATDKQTIIDVVLFGYATFQRHCWPFPEY